MIRRALHKLLTTAAVFLLVAACSSYVADIGCSTSDFAVDSLGGLYLLEGRATFGVNLSSDRHQSSTYRFDAKVVTLTSNVVAFETGLAARSVVVDMSIWAILALVSTYPLARFACGLYRRHQRRRGAPRPARGEASASDLDALAYERPSVIRRMTVILAAALAGVGLALGVGSYYCMISLFVSLDPDEPDRKPHAQLQVDRGWTRATLWMPATASLPGGHDFHTRLLSMTSSTRRSPPAVHETELLAHPPVTFSLVILAAVWPVIALVRGPCRRYRRRRRGLCLKCSYDLTGNTSGVCPECGQRI